MVELKRNCPDCECEIIYKSEGGYKNAIKKGSVCRKCASSGDRNGMYGKTGELNPFYGKSHSEETINKLKILDRSYTQTQEFKNKISKSTSGSNNGMYGKSVYSIWLDKYGKDIADHKMSEYKQKQSELNSGENNNMYGKPSPMGSGNGWSGWYKGWFFRSLKELTYMIKVIERYGLQWESAEMNAYKIQYKDYNGNIKNYFPDFIIENKYLVEVKPKRLWNSDIVSRKKEAAIEFCNENGLIYKIRDISCLSQEKLIDLYNQGLIKFTDRYEKKWKSIIV